MRKQNKLIVVDDEADVRFSLKEMLRREGLPSRHYALW